MSSPVNPRELHECLSVAVDSDTQFNASAEKDVFGLDQGQGATPESLPIRRLTVSE